jgi:hypothetical protein
VNAVKVLESLASLHLDVMFVPVALLDIPLSKASYLGDTVHPSTSISETRRARIEDALRANKRAMELNRSFPSPTVSLNIYLNFAELKVLQESEFEAVVYWTEARDLFLHLFVDGVGIPLIGRAPISLVSEIQNVIKRLVRLLMTFDKGFINQNILVFDIYVMCTIDVGRAQDNFRKLASAIATQTAAVFSGASLSDSPEISREDFKWGIPEFESCKYSIPHSEAPIFDDTDAYSELSFWYPWLSGSSLNESPGNRLETVLVQNCWRSFTIFDRVEKARDTNHILKSLSLFRSLRSLSISMNSIR